ncbi:PKD domain-containing protein [Kitasatospora sp. NPDC088346]|uniref:PKD domain-containing protein n=1 Tax=Kitasatospora sp. NPDC088346 TaxID=3364073 RepID=UPI00381DACED
MRIRRALGLTAAGATVVLAVPVPALADSPDTLYVNNAAPAHCSDAGPGTQEQPFCTVTAAANVVEPGQTVQVRYTQGYLEEVHLTRSGTPEKPITFVGTPATTTGSLGKLPVVGRSGHGFVLTGVHDVVVRQFAVRSTLDGVTVADSARVTVDANTFGSDVRGAAVRVTGQSEHVTVSRNRLYQSAGVVAEGGARDTVVTTNDFSRTLSGVRGTDAPGLTVVHNTVAFACGPSVTLDGASTGAVVENNVLTAHNSESLATGPATVCGADTGGRGESEVVVAAAATTGTTVDFNVVHPFPDASAYTWAGTAYRTPQALTAATGQARHDADQDVRFNPGNLPERNTLLETATAAIDSADPAAPGTLPADLEGRTALDDPLVANTPGGTGRDRGAHELEGLHGVSLQTSGVNGAPDMGPAPLDIRLTAAVTNSWPTKVTFTYEFDDGSAPLVTTDTSVLHTYTAVGAYHPTVTATDELGVRVTSPLLAYVYANRPGPLVPVLNVKPVESGPALTYWADSSGSSGPWSIRDFRADFGDGTVVSSGFLQHTYARPGSYTVTLTETDAGGRTASVSKVVNADYTDAQKALRSGERVRVLAQTSNDGLSDGQANYTSGSWSPFAKIAPADPAPVSVAAAYTANGNLHAVRTAFDGMVEIADWDRTGTLWGGWSAVPGKVPAGLSPSVAQVAATSIGNKLHVVALAEGRVFEAVGDYDSGRWSAWGEITAATWLHAPVSRIAVAATGNTLHVAALGADGHLRVADGDYTRGTWSNGDLTAYIGGPSGITELSAAAIGSKFHVLALAGGNVHQATGDYAAGTWTSWANVSDTIGLGGSVTRLSAAATGNTLHLYGVANGRIHNANGDYTAGRWSAWADVTAPDRNAPTSGITGLAAAGS